MMAMFSMVFERQGEGSGEVNGQAHVGLRQFAHNQDRLHATTWLMRLLFPSWSNLDCSNCSPACLAIGFVAVVFATIWFAVLQPQMAERDAIREVRRYATEHGEVADQAEAPLIDMVATAQRQRNYYFVRSEVEVLLPLAKASRVLPPPCPEQGTSPKVTIHGHNVAFPVEMVWH
jgi:hypothetical protein